MIEESKEFSMSVLWFSTLVGKKANFDVIYKQLEKSENIKNIKSTTFYQGKLARWGLAWSFFEVQEMKGLCEKKSCEKNIIHTPSSSNTNFSRIFNPSIRFTYKKEKHNKIAKSYCEL